MEETIARSFLILFTILIPGLLSVAAKKKKAAQQAAKSTPDTPQAAEYNAPIVGTPPRPTAPPFPKAVMGGEGEDACHAYMLDTQTDAPAAAVNENANLSNELVRSFIFSEILQRPKSLRGRQGA